MRIGVAATTLLYFWMTVATASADFFGSGENRFEIPFVVVGDPGNVKDTTGGPNQPPNTADATTPAGRVDYVFQIGKYEISEEVVRKANAQSELDGKPLGITLDDRGPEKPATGVSWFEAARFVNWLNDDAGAGPAYKFDDTGAFQLWTPADPGYNPANPFRSTLARYALPSVDEWYKAAYYDPVTGVWWDYPTGSDDPPTPVASGTDPGTAVWGQSIGPADIEQAGGPNPFGTVAQAGNVAEWQETTADLANADPLAARIRRGGQWLGSSENPVAQSSSFLDPFGDPSNGGFNVGLRIVRIPEPSAAVLFLFVSIPYATCRRSVSQAATQPVGRNPAN